MIMPGPRRVFDWKTEMDAKIRACEASGKLTDKDRKVLKGIRSLRKPTQDDFKLFWQVCERCGVK